MESEQQHIRIMVVLEIIGKPKEYIEEKMKEYVARIKEDIDLILLNDKIFEAKEQEKIWSVFAEIELVIKGVANLIGFCIEYMPASIEIIKPESFTFEDRIFTGVVNDILAKLHGVDMIAKQFGTENTFLKKNMNRIIRNQILISLKFGINSIEGIVKATGIDEKELKTFLSQLIEEKRISEENGIYSII